MRTIHIDCAGVKSEGEVCQRYLDAAQPEGAGYFGCNLNAFWDAVEGGGPGWPGEAELVFTNSADLFHLPNGRSFLKELRNIAKEATFTRVELA